MGHFLPKPLGESSTGSTAGANIIFHIILQFNYGARAQSRQGLFLAMLGICPNRDSSAGLLCIVEIELLQKNDLSHTAGRFID